MEVKMFNGNICCRSLEKVEEKNNSGIIVPTTEKSFKELVVLVSEEPLVEVGKVIIVPSFKGTPWKFEEENLEIVNISDIILIKE